MAEHKKQHFVPQSYLAAWCDPDTPPEQEPYVWRCTKDGSECRRKAPQNIFHETDMYTLHLPGGGRDLRLERGLAGLEGTFASLRTRLLASPSALTAEDRLHLAAFMGAMHSRTPKQRDHWRKQWQEVADMMHKMRDSVAKMTPQQRASIPPTVPSGGPTFEMEDVEALAENPIPALIYTAIQGVFPTFAEMNLTFLWTTDRPGFITSDSPCMVGDPEAHKRPFPYNSVGLGFKTVEVLMPIAPTCTAYLCWKPLPLHVNATPSMVTAVNRQARAMCYEHFVVNQNLVRPEWLKTG